MKKIWIAFALSVAATSAFAQSAPATGTDVVNLAPGDQTTVTQGQTVVIAGMESGTAIAIGAGLLLLLVVAGSGGGNGGSSTTTTGN